MVRLFVIHLKAVLTDYASFLDYCAQQGLPHPLYRPSSNGNLWHCDISVKDNLFRTVRECKSLGEAQNTAAHTSLHQLMVIGDPSSGSFCNLPTTASTAAKNADPPVSLSMEKQCAEILHSGKALYPKKQARPPQYAGVAKAVPPSTMSKRARKKLNARQSQERLQPSLPPPASSSSVVARSSNKIPLTKSRLAPITEVSKPVEDPLASLRRIERELKQLKPPAPFRKIMESK